MGRLLAAVTAGCCAAALGACTGTPEAADESAATPSASSSPADPSASSSPTAPSSSATPSPTPTGSAAERWGPVSLPALAEREVRGDDLRFGPVRERTAAYVSRQVTYRVRSGDRTLRISGVLNVPRGQGRGPFATVVLAHGYIEPSVYESGQGMTRERGWLAERGHVALHVDYRNHAGSDRDPANDRRTRLGYVEDVVAAAQALERARRVPVDDDRVFLMGRSMGGGVALRTLTTHSGVFQGAVAWASVSSREPENFRQFMGDAEDAPVVTELRRRHGLPGDPGSRRFWRGVSARTFFDRVEDPVLLVHGTSDDTCPPRWARDSYRALKRAGAPARIAWYADEHAFGPRFEAAMRRSVEFFRRAAR